LLDAIRVAKATGDIPSLVAFAIKPELLTAFLRSAGSNPFCHRPLRLDWKRADVAAKRKPSLECEASK